MLLIIFDRVLASFLRREAHIRASIASGADQDQYMNILAPLDVILFRHLNSNLFNPQNA